MQLTLCEKQSGKAVASRQVMASRERHLLRCSFQLGRQSLHKLAAASFASSMLLPPPLLLAMILVGVIFH